LSFFSAQNYAQKSDSVRHIKGTIIYQNKPIENVNIALEKTPYGTQSDTEGTFEINAFVGQTIILSHVRFKTQKIKIKKRTQYLTIQLEIDTNELEEVVLRKRKKKERDAYTKALDYDVIIPGQGNLNPLSTSSSVHYLNQDDIARLPDTGILRFLNGRFPTVIAQFINFKGGYILFVDGIEARFYIDGVFYKNQDHVPDYNVSDMEHIYIIKQAALVIIRTKNDPYTLKLRKKILLEKYRNQNYYQNNSESIEYNSEFVFHPKKVTSENSVLLPNSIISTNNLLKKLIALNEKSKALDYYHQVLTDAPSQNFDLKLDAALLFTSMYDDQKITVDLLKLLEAEYATDVEKLRSIGFYYQALHERKLSNSIYKTIFNLQPEQAQSYRDLADAYRTDEQYSKSWKTYLLFLLNNHDIKNEGIGKLMYSDMEFLFFNRKKLSAITETFIPKHNSKKEFESDIRFVFEWNSPEAEFELEFVGPEDRVFHFNHSLEDNEELILDELEKGYNSKEFTIKEILQHNWFVNLTYFGADDKSFRFKVTTYHNWGRYNQRKEIKVYKLSNVMSFRKILLKSITENSI
jgi:hypothetical protein